MAYTDLREFIRALEKNDELKRIPFEVDPHLEITEFADRCRQTRRPRAALRETQGLSTSPSCQRLRLHEAQNGTRPRSDIGRRGRRPHPRIARNAQCPKVSWASSKCSPSSPKSARSSPKSFPGPLQGSHQDRTASRSSITPCCTAGPTTAAPSSRCPMVFSKNPDTGKRNCGMYRMQVFDDRTTGNALADPQAGRRTLPPPPRRRAASAWTSPSPSAPTPAPCTPPSSRCRPTSTK